MITSVRHSTLTSLYKSMLLRLSDTKVTSDEPNNALVCCCTQVFPVRQNLSVLCKRPDEEVHHYGSWHHVSNESNATSRSKFQLLNFTIATVDVLLVEKCLWSGITSYISSFHHHHHHVCLSVEDTDRVFLLKSPCTGTNSSFAYVAGACVGEFKLCK